MAERRMLAKSVTDSDEFTSLSSAAQALYMHLNLGADDDGFTNQVQLAMFKAHASIDDLKILLAKKYLLQFDNGVIVIRHWRMNNLLRGDRKKDTNYKNLLNALQLEEDGTYTETDNHLSTICQPTDNQVTPQDRLGKDSIGKDSIGKFIIPPKPPLTEKGKTVYADDVTLTKEEYQKLVDEYGEDATKDMIEILSNYKGSSGKKYKSDYKAILTWVVRQWKDNHRENIVQQQQLSTAEIVRQRMKEREIRF